MFGPGGVIRQDRTQGVAFGPRDVGCGGDVAGDVESGAAHIEDTVHTQYERN